MGQGLSNTARSTHKHVLRSATKAAKAARRQRRRPPHAAASAPNAVEAEGPRPPEAAAGDGGAAAAPAPAAAAPAAGVGVTETGSHPSADDEHARFSINANAQMVPAGPWTVGDAPVTDELLDLVQSKDADLVRLMTEMPEIQTSAPKESLGSRKISRTLPQDRSSHPRTKLSAPPQADGTLNTGQVTEMLTAFAKTPPDSVVTREVLVENLAKQYCIDPDLADAILTHVYIPGVKTRYRAT